MAPLISPAPDLVHVVSVSGGKDSTATVLALREAGIAARYVFADTGWEAPETYAYLDTLRSLLGITIDVVAHPGGMEARATKKAGFPMRMGRWCTEDLKIKPLRAYHDAIADETLSVVGIRGQESAARAKMVAFENSDQWGGFVWRPLLGWKIEDVIAIHHRHGVPVNPLYRRGHDRVGCYPCIFSNKEEIALIAKNAPERVAQIARLEREFTAERARRNAAGEGKFAHGDATFFAPRMPGLRVGIEEVVAWSQTDRGGRQLPLLAEPPRGGCMRWGLCDVAPEAVPDATDDEGEAA